VLGKGTTRPVPDGFRRKPQLDDWRALIDRVARLQAEHGLNLLVLDPLAAFLPGRDENTAGPMLETLMSLRQLTGLGMSVLLLHHPRKGELAVGQAARGSGALSAFVDILLEMRWHNRPDSEDRRRRLVCFSRHAETPRQLVIELSADGTDYLAHGSYEDEEFTACWERLKMVLEDATYKLNRREIREQWPPDYKKPQESTFWRWLERAVDRGLVSRDGTGRRNEPFRYWLPSQEAIWRRESPLWQVMEYAQQEGERKRMVKEGRKR